MDSNEIALSTFSSKSKLPSLPTNFAMTIIEKEIELDKRCTAGLITELVDLYSQAIEFYNYNNDPKYFDYQDRMHKMLSKPSVMSTLSPVKNRNKSPIPSGRSDLEKSKILMAAEINSTLSVTSHKAERSITRTIDQNENNTKETAVKLAGHFKKQDDDLLTRLESRRKMNKTFTSESQGPENPANLTYSNALEMLESEKSASFSVSRAEINKKIEELMEFHFAEKAAKIAEISVKYEKEILEMQEDGVMALIVAQMRENMKQEIESVSKEYDERRRAEVLRLKQELHGFM